MHTISFIVSFLLCDVVTFIVYRVAEGYVRRLYARSKARRSATSRRLPCLR